MLCRKGDDADQQQRDRAEAVPSHRNDDLEVAAAADPADADSFWREAIDHVD